jgi:hypothetical protein
VGKVYNLCRVKTDISAVLKVKSGLDPHMIIEPEDDLSCCSLFCYCCCCLFNQSFIIRVGINLNLVNAC